MLNIKALTNNTGSIANIKTDFKTDNNVYSSLVSSSVQDTIAFGSKKENNTEEPKKRKFNFPLVTGLVSAATQLFGGICLVVSAMLPGSNSKAQDELPPLPHEDMLDRDVLSYRAVPVENKIQILKDEKQAQDIMDMVKKALNKMGWTSLSIGSLTSGVGIAGMGMKSNQPSIVLGGLGVLACAPVMILDPSIPMRGAINISLATFFSGFANKIRNDNELKPGEAPREFDLSFLKDKQLWKESLRDDIKAQELNSKLLDTAKFIVQDQVLLLTNAKKAVDQSVKKLFGIRKELPDFMTIKPSSDQRRITSMLVYAGGIPLLVFGGSVESLVPIANSLTGAGFCCGNLGMFALGRKQNDSTKPALLIGVPLKLMGDFLQTTDWGFGLSRMGSASHNYYVAMQNKDKKPVENKNNSDDNNSGIVEKEAVIPSSTQEKRFKTHDPRADFKRKEQVKLQKGLRYHDRAKNRMKNVV